MTGPADDLDDDLRRRLRVYPLLLLVALGAAFTFVIVAGDGSGTASGRVGGDFPAFYGAGTIVADGDVDSLYDPEVQAAVQDGLLGDEDGFVMYPYAPHVAAAYQTFAALPYRTAYVLHTALMVTALIGALWLLRPVIGLLDRWFAAGVAGMITAYPVFVGTTGGQNTALTLLLIAAAWRAWHDDRDAWAGLALAALLHRPQYALPLIGLALLDRRTRTVAVAAVGAAGIWLANAALVGASWITIWLDGAGPLLEADAEVNARNEIAPMGALHALLGVDSTIALVLGGTVSLGAAAGLAWLWWQRPVDLNARMAITCAALALLGPHAIFYDTALLGLTALVLVDRRRADPWLFVGLWLAGAAHVAVRTSGVSHLVLVVLATVALAAIRLLGAGADPPTTQAGEPERVLPSQDSYSRR